MTTSKGIFYRTPFFELKAVPSEYIAAPDSNGFEPPRSPPQAFTPFGIVTTIKGISKRASERNRVRTRFKQAVRMVLTRDAQPTGKNNDRIFLTTERQGDDRPNTSNRLLLEREHQSDRDG
jgi:hypothetical protein